ncbi:MAG: M23 family metallopeptidase [Sphingobacteriales bacterium]|nr:M23 family metallopeptidase [Sphingobacteriales bacterium]
MSLVLTGNRRLYLSTGWLRSGYRGPALIFLLLLFLMSCSVSKNPLRRQVRLLQRGILKDDTSYVYALPYGEGKTFRVIQGYFSRFTHKERAALDFNMKRGTKICAAREGVVVRVKEDGKKGGLDKKYRPDGNHIIIQHPDGTRAGYWHLQYNGALVNVGDTVKKGQVIALSGKTGYAFNPHLHFLVWRSSGGQWQQVPTRFATAKGIKYLKGWKRYKNNAPGTKEP